MRTNCSAACADYSLHNYTWQRLVCFLNKDVEVFGWCSGTPIQKTQTCSQMNKEGSKQENMNKSAEREGGMTNGWWVMTTNKGNGLSMMGNKCFAQSVGSIAPENGALCPWHTEH